MDREIRCGSLKRLIAALLAGSMIFLPGCARETRSVQQTEPSEAAETLAAVPAAEDCDTYVGYLGSTFCAGSYYACGTGGRLDRIAEDGTVEPVATGVTQDLTGLWSDGTLLLCCGKKGTILFGDASHLTACTAGEDNLLAVTMYRGCIYAAGENGRIHMSCDGTTWSVQQLPVQVEIVGIAALDDLLMAITADTDIFTSQDGLVWTAENFNQTMDGMGPAYMFHSLVDAGETFFVIGSYRDEPEMPLMLYTESGEVWLEKTLAEINEEPLSGLLPLTVNDLAFGTDQFYAACEEGNLITVTACSVCNLMERVTDVPLRTSCIGEDTLLVAGGGFFSRVTKESANRQYAIRAPQAQADISNGAVLIDVRTAEERQSDGYIPGSIHIPVDEIETRLTETVPDLSTELIFYCAAGKRAQSALETALELGYTDVYNLGGLADWPYDIQY